MDDESTPWLALVGGDEPWPLAGHLRGSLPGSEVSVSWVGRVGLGAGPEVAWRASRALERGLRRGGPLVGDRRRALAGGWARIDAVADDVLGPGGGADLVLLLLATDDDGIALSAVGLRGLLAIDDDGCLRSWLEAPHPLFVGPGRPSKRPGALTLAAAPRWLVGAATDIDAIAGQALGDVLPRCGVHG